MKITLLLLIFIPILLGLSTMWGGDKRMPPAQVNAAGRSERFKKASYRTLEQMMIESDARSPQTYPRNPSEIR